jgi:hypothetical protein
MQQLRKRIIFTLASAFSLSVLAVAPVWAEHGSNSTGRSGADDTVASASESDDTTADKEGSESLRDQAEKLLAAKRENKKEHTQTEKKKSCEAHKTEINKRVNNYATAAQRHLDVFDGIFAKVQAFQTKKQLNVANYDTLVATATTKQVAAQAAVDELKALDVSIDCTQPDPATSLAKVKAATANARTALHEYRLAIKDVVVALKGASTSTTDKSSSDSTDTTTDTTTGGNQ